MYNTIYPININQYQRKNIAKNTPKEKKSQDLNEQSNSQSQTSTDPNGKRRNPYPQQEFPNGKKTTIDYSKSTINIAQVVTDFRNTEQAIAAPEEVTQEINAYLDLIQKQISKEEPNEKIIKANFKNASQILDKYITESLNKPSKVVENWIDALFLQKINYKADENDINEAFKVKLPENTPAKLKEKRTITQEDLQNSSEYIENPINSSKKQPNISIQEEISQPSNIYVPQDETLKKLFIKAKKYSSIDNPQKALNAFVEALSKANEIQDEKAKSMIYFEIGKVYDKSDNLSDALLSYQKCTQLAQDNNLKAQAHYSMGKIYDETVEFQGAMEHYFNSMSFAGVEDNINIQTKALSNIASMFSDKYDKSNTLEYTDLAQKYAQETKNKKVIGNIYSKSGDILAKLGENSLAMNYYKTSTENYNQINDTKKVIKNLQKAALVMEEYGNYAKAKNLREKAEKLAKK